MNSTEISIPRALTIQLLHLAQTSPEHEICGLISARSGKPSRCYPITNIAEQQKHRFLLDPTQQIAAITTMRESGEELFAIYHSHPSAPALPSATDLSMAAYPNAYYLIISLNTKGILEMRGFKLAGNDFFEIPLSLER